ncbi:P-loop NTPase family protein [Derxia lacustris]|uniref:CpsD/CapB family tyrosine-protein kinase n=1 Tax=Derxia lacustris TaxID=764842 RepID=UPI00111C27A1|nr:CpsD/CapB family tyrosine-protein kinase [Derxia lacustris]
MPLDSRIDLQPVARPPVDALTGEHADQAVSQAVIDLVLRLDALVPASAGRVTEFIAPSGGEGVSTVAWSFAEVAATLYGRRVLVLGISPEVLGDAASRHRPLFEALRGGIAVDDLVSEVGHNLHAGALVPAGHSRRRTAADLTDVSAWRLLRARFDEIVLDVPPASRSKLGLVCAPFADAVLVVLEAERTRAPVAEKLVANLRALRANVVGTVLNKRRFYVPDAVYRRL